MPVLFSKPLALRQTATQHEPTLTYKGYTARVEYSAEDEAFVGHILGIRAINGFHGESVSELKQAFEEAEDDYVEMCARIGQEPEKPASGRLVLRLPVGLHHRLRREADRSDKSLHAVIVDRLEEYGAA